MNNAYKKEIYKEYTKILESVNIVIPASLEESYKKYIQNQMKDMPYLDTAVIRMYTLVFFLKYVKQIEGSVKFKDVYSKLEMQKKLISRAMDTVEIQFDTVEENPVFLEDWSSLYSIKHGIGAGIMDLKHSQIDK
ncbi:hypothetical protein NEOKW01_0552 [Nematocida sp. AWRm80]|nr:hypothetical protein NEOKW01_0552 [Nematocida sp. AWRm80]